MTEPDLPRVLLRFRNRCANCNVFDWQQPDRDTLKQCGKCKVVQYCGQHCQKEHWMLLHKQDCKVLAFMRSNGCNAFPALKAEDDNLEFLKILMLKVIFKMLSSDQVSADPRAHGLLTQLWEKIQAGHETNCALRKIWPRANPSLSSNLGDLFDQTRETYVRDMNLTIQDLWSTLCLLWGRFIDFRHVALLNNLKDPQETLPKEVWVGFQEEIGVFPDRVAELIQAMSGDKIPPFKELLKIICGGTLLQRCSFCDTRMTVKAVQGEVEGCSISTASVALFPHMPLIFFCGNGECLEEMKAKLFIVQKWRVGITSTVNRLISSRCDYCFKLADEVHRYL